MMRVSHRLNIPLGDENVPIFPRSINVSLIENSHILNTSENIVPINSHSPVKPPDNYSTSHLQLDSITVQNYNSKEHLELELKEVFNSQNSDYNEKEQLNNLNLDLNLHSPTQLKDIISPIIEDLNLKIMNKNHHLSREKLIRFLKVIRSDATAVANFKKAQEAIAEPNRPPKLGRPPKSYNNSTTNQNVTYKKYQFSDSPSWNKEHIQTRKLKYCYNQDSIPTLQKSSLDNHNEEPKTLQDMHSPPSLSKRLKSARKMAYEIELRRGLRNKIWYNPEKECWVSLIYHPNKKTRKQKKFSVQKFGFRNAFKEASRYVNNRLPKELLKRGRKPLNKLSQNPQPDYPLDNKTLPTKLSDNSYILRKKGRELSSSLNILSKKQNNSNDHPQQPSSETVNFDFNNLEEHQESNKLSKSRISKRINKISHGTPASRGTHKSSYETAKDPYYNTQPLRGRPRSKYSYYLKDHQNNSYETSSNKKRYMTRPSQVFRDKSPIAHIQDQRTKSNISQPKIDPDDYHYDDDETSSTKQPNYCLDYYLSPAEATDKLLASQPTSSESLKRARIIDVKSAEGGQSGVVTTVLPIFVYEHMTQCFEKLSHTNKTSDISTSKIQNTSFSHTKDQTMNPDDTYPYHHLTSIPQISHHFDKSEGLSSSNFSNTHLLPLLPKSSNFKSHFNHNMESKLPFNNHFPNKITSSNNFPTSTSIYQSQSQPIDLSFENCPPKFLEKNFSTSKHVITSKFIENTDNASLINKLTIKIPERSIVANSVKTLGNYHLDNYNKSIQKVDEALAWLDSFSTCQSCHN